MCKWCISARKSKVWSKSPFMINRALLHIYFGNGSPMRPQLRKLKLNQQMASLSLVTHRIIYSAFFMSDDAILIYLIQYLTILFVCDYSRSTVGKMHLTFS